MMEAWAWRPNLPVWAFQQSYIQSKNHLLGNTVSVAKQGSSSKSSYGGPRTMGFRTTNYGIYENHEQAV